VATDLTVSLENRPGRLADLAEALGAAGVNIEGLAATTHGASGEVHVLVEDADAALAALSKAGIEVATQTDVVVADMSGREDTPGAGGEVARRVADAGINVTLVYTATKNRIVVAADDLATLRGAIG